jgi:hypothetical protein
MQVFDVVELTHDGLGFSANVQLLLHEAHSAKVHSGVV